ncbi:MAG: tRNA (adenosine(37)-N6)-threonylcarbamoyltransferase complex ATPase subunit type 1 TsaE [Bacteroidota bacterium]
MEFPCVYTVTTVNQLDAFTAELLQSVDVKLFLIEGDLGSGKTTLVQSCCRQLQVIDVVQSPTFALVNEYRTINNQVIYHLDLYRVQSREELLDIGIDEYLYSGHYCFIEWPKIIKDYIGEKYISVYIEHADNNNRQIKLKRYE